MFYSQNILHKRHGKFGVIWIAATKGSNLTKREYFTVNLVQSCDDIIRMLTLRAQPLYAGGPRPRLSLYLSSQLMFGCVKVYNKQSDYLLTDLTELQRKFGSLIPSVPIDLAPQTVRTIHAQAGVDPVSSPVLDPDFGKLRPIPLDMSLDKMPKVEVWQPLPDAAALSPEASRPDIELPLPDAQPPRALSPAKRRHRPEPNESLQARIGDITLLEEPVLPTSTDQTLMPGELDLPPMTKEALAEFDAIDDTGKERPKAKEAGVEPKAKRPRKMSLAEEPLYVGERCDVVERERRQFDEQLDAQQGVIDDILRRNDGDSQNMAVDDELDLQQERAKLHQMQQEFEESLREAEMEAEMRDVEAGIAPGLFEPVAPEPQREDEVLLMQPVTDATLQDDGRLAPADETPAVQVGVPPEQVDLIPQHRGVPTPGVTPAAEAAVEERGRLREQFRLDLSPVEAVVPRVTPRHRRQLKFADAETEIKRETIFHNIQRGSDTCGLHEISDPRFQSASTLFEMPTRRMPSKLRRLWKRNAFTRSVPTGNEVHSCWGVPGLIPSSESESDRRSFLDDLTLSPVRPDDEQRLIAEQEQAAQLPTEMPQMAEEQTLPEGSGVRDLSSAEVARDATRDMSAQQMSMEAVRDTSRGIVEDLMLSGSFVVKSATKESPETADRPKPKRPRKSTTPEDVSSKAATVSPEITELSLIQEERELQASPVLRPGEDVRLVQAAPAEILDDLETAQIRAQLQLLIERETEMKDVTTFKSVCPTSTQRKIAARMFCALLGLCKLGKVAVQQEVPYSDIYIFRGENFDD